MLSTYVKVLELFDRREKGRFWLLVFMALLMGFANVAGIAAIIPFLGVIAQPEIVSTNPYLAWAYDGLGFEERDAFLSFLGLTMFCVIVFGLAFRAATTYALLRFSYMRNYALSSRLLAGYLAQPYAWFLNRHSADLGKTLLSEVDQVISGSIAPAMRAIPHVVVVLAMIVVLLLVDPVVTLFAALFVGGSYLGIFLGVRRFLSRAGAARVEANRRRYQIVQEALGGVKEVKLLNLEPTYLGRFRRHALTFVTKQAARTFVGQMPRYLLEGVASGGMILLVLALLAREGGDLDKALPVIGLFAFAGARMLPEMQQLYIAMTQMRFGRPALDSLHRDLMLVRGPAATADAPPPLGLTERLDLDGVVYAYPGAQQGALRDLTLSIEARTTVGLVGGTGAGKTTAVDVMLGLLEPQGGALRVDGVAINRGNLRAWQRSVGYVPQHIFLLDDTIAANIAFGVEPSRIDHAAVERAARIAELHAFVAEELPQGYATKVGERGVRLSGGQRQRIGIARALYRDPDVLVLDEATSALDTLTERAVMDAVRNLGGAKTIVMIAHRLSTVRGCDVIFLLDRGRVIAQGAYDELIETNERFRAMASTAA